MSARKKRNELSISAMLFVLAVVLAVIGKFLPATFIVCPILAWLMFKQDPLFFPAVIILYWSDGYAGYTAQATALVLAVLNGRRHMHRISYALPLALLLVPLPLVGYVVYRNSSVFGLFNTFTIEPLLPYLSIFFYFYGCLLAKKWNEVATGMTLLSLLTIPWINYLQVFYSPATFYLAGCCGAGCVFILFGHLRIFERGLLAAVIVSFVLALYLGEDSLTLLLLFVYSAILALVYLAGFRGGFRLLTSVFVFLAGGLMVAYAINNYEEKSFTSGGGYDYDELHRSSYSYEILRERVLMKLYDDRGGLWRAAWLQAIEPPYWIPKVIRDELEVETTRGTKIKSALGAHNFFLQTIQYVRWGIGFPIIIILLGVYFMASRSIVKANQKAGLFLALVLPFFACGFIHVMTGNPVLGYGVVLMSIGGVVIHYEPQAVNRNHGMVNGRRGGLQ